MTPRDKIQLQGNRVYVNGHYFAKVELYKGNNRLRLWLTDGPANFTIVDNKPDAVKAFALARRAALKK